MSQAQLTALGSKLGPGNAARLADCLKAAKAGDLSPLTTFVGELESALGISQADHGGDAGLQDYDAILQDVGNFKMLCQNQSSEVLTAVELVEDLFQAQRKFLELTAEHRNPGDAGLQALLEPSANIIRNIQEHREKNRRHAAFNHLSMISESVPALGWVGVSPAPAPFVREMRDAGQFYANRVLREKKEDKNIVNAWIALLNRLADFVKQHHTTGLQWNSNGTTLQANQMKSSAPRQDPKMEQKPKKKVVYGSVQGVKEEKFELDGKWWLLEYINGKSDIQVEVAEPNLSVSLFKCENSVVKVVGKCNKIVLNACKKVGLVFDTLVSSAEVINCNGIEIQTLGRVPTITLDKSDTVSIYLSDQSKGCEIVTAKTAGVNIMVPESNGEFKEHPVPEQYKTMVVGTKLVTKPTESF